LSLRTEADSEDTGHCSEPAEALEHAQPQDLTQYSFELYCEKSHRIKTQDSVPTQAVTGLSRQQKQLRQLRNELLYHKETACLSQDYGLHFEALKADVKV
jgi:hypothetical protein